MTVAATGGWLYPHDVRDIPGLAATLRDARIETVCLAALYHSLLAVAPGNRVNPVFEFASTAAYFEPDPRRWRSATLRPRVSPAVREAGDVLEFGRRFAEQAGASLTAWLVCLHDDALVRDRPELAVETATGDRLLGAPCLAAPEVADYAARLVGDVGGRADALQLESLHWTAQPHARHAKVDGAAPRLSRLMLSLCFCRRCRIRAEGLGIDAGHVAAELTRQWTAAWDGVAADDPAQIPGLDGYLMMRAGIVTELIAQVAGSVSVPVEVVTFGDATLHGLDATAVQAAGVDVRVLAYGSPQHVAATLGGQGTASVGCEPRHVGLSVLPEHVHDVDDAMAGVAAAATAGAASVHFYHLGLAGERRRGWLPALADAWRAGRRTAEEDAQ